MMIKQPQMAKVQSAQLEQLKLANAPVEQYSPPAQQHAAATVPVQIDSKKTLQPQRLACISKWEPSPIPTLRSFSSPS